VEKDGDDEPDARSVHGRVRGPGAGWVIQVAPPPPRGRRRRRGPRRIGGLRQARLRRRTFPQGQRRRRSLFPVIGRDEVRSASRPGVPVCFLKRGKCSSELGITPVLCV
jgi:hypothetical protein